MDLFTLSAKLGLDASKFQSGIKQAESAGSSLSEKMSGMFNKIESAAKVFISGAAINKAVEMVRGLADETAEAGNRIDKQSQVLGMSRKAYQEWDYILSQNGVSIDNMSVAMKTLNNLVLSGIDDNKEAKEAFAELGISIHQLENMTPEEQFEFLVRKFQEMPAGAKKTALAIKVFGKQGMQLLPLLNNTTDSIDEMRERAQELGLIMGDDAVDASVKYTDSMDTLQRTFGALKMAIGAKLLPIFTSAVERITKYAGKLKKAFDEKGFAGVFATIVDDIKKNFPTWDQIKEWVVEKWGQIQEGFKKIAIFIFGEDENGGIKWPTAAEVGEKIKEGVKKFWGIVQDIGKGILKLVFGEDEEGGIHFPTGEEIAVKVKEGLSALWNGLKDLLSPVLKLIFGEDDEGGIHFPDAATLWNEKIKPAFEKFWEIIKGLIKGVANWVLGELGLPDVDEIVKKITDWWEGVKAKIRLTLGFGLQPDQTTVDEHGNVTTTYKGTDTESFHTGDDDFGGSSRGFAKGLPTVPYDNFPALLHRGERILTASQARDYGGSVDLSGLKSEIISAVREGIANATVKAFINGRDVTDEVNRNNMQAVKARRFAY